MNKIIENLKLLNKISLLKSIKINLKIRNINRLKIGKIYVFKGSKIILKRKSQINVRGNLFWGLISINKFYDKCKSQSLLSISDRGKLDIDGNVIFGPESRVIIEKNAKMSVGDKTYFSAQNKILCSNEVNIGKECSISWNILIMDTDGKHIIGKTAYGKVYIGNRVWVGANTTILKDTYIGDGCIIAANSVVKGVFPEKCLIAGNPAKIIRKNVEWN